MEIKRRLEFLKRLCNECTESPRLSQRLKDFYKEYGSADFMRLLELEEKFQAIVAIYLHYSNKLIDKEKLFQRLEEIFNLPKTKD